MTTEEVFRQPVFCHCSGFINSRHTVFNWAKAERRMLFASFRPNNTTFTVYDAVSLSPGSGNTAGFARFPRYDPISSTIPFSLGKPVPKPGSRYVRSAPRFPAMSRLDPGSPPHSVPEPAFPAFRSPVLQK